MWNTIKNLLSDGIMQNIDLWGRPNQGNILLGYKQYKHTKKEMLQYYIFLHPFRLWSWFSIQVQENNTIKESIH